MVSWESLGSVQEFNRKCPSSPEDEHNPDALPEQLTPTNIPIPRSYEIMGSLPPSYKNHL